MMNYTIASDVALLGCCKQGREKGPGFHARGDASYQNLKSGVGNFGLKKWRH
jgi:hypothetical protein